MPARFVARIVRGIVLAAAIGGVGLTVMPAQAASTIYVHPIVETPVQYYPPQDHHRRHFYPRPHLAYPYFVPPYYARPYQPRAVCMSSNQIRRSVARRGFNGVSIFSASGALVRLTAHRGRGEYVITANRCTGEILAVRRRF